MKNSSSSSSSTPPLTIIKKQSGFSPPPLTDFDELLLGSGGESITKTDHDHGDGDGVGGNLITVTIENEVVNHQTPKRRKVTLAPKSKKELFPPIFADHQDDHHPEFILPDVTEGDSSPLSSSLVLSRRRGARGGNNKPRMVRGPTGELVKEFFFRQRNGREMPCIICDKVYVCKKFLQRHKVAKHRLCKPVHQLDCDHCGAVFADVGSFKRHCEDTELQIKEFYEKGLHEKTVQKKNSVKHTNTRKLALLQKRMSQRELELKLDEEEKQEQELAQEQQLVVKEEPAEELFTCDVCFYVANLETIRAHVSSEHPVDNEGQMENHISSVLNNE